MGDLLDALHRLQTIELALSKLRQQQDRKTRQIRTAERQLAKLDDQTADLHRQQIARQAEVDHLDLDVKSREASILKHREELLKARTNKDYAAILTAINTEKADSAKVEKLALEKMAELERVQTEVAALADQRSKAEERYEKASRALEEYMNETADERGKLEGQRDGASEAVPPSAYSTFIRVAEKHEGEAMAEVVRLHPKREEFACGGCNMTLTLERVYALKSRDEIQLCGACGRILYPTAESSSV